MHIIKWLAKGKQEKSFFHCHIYVQDRPIVGYISWQKKSRAAVLSIPSTNAHQSFNFILPVKP